MAEISLKIEGMSCQHCVMRVKKALDAVDGVVSSEVEIGAAKITYDENRTDKEKITQAINETGYKVVG
jgi:copper chaperone